jgi:cyclopropane-fatty-acyl-phospholipid synthase
MDEIFRLSLGETGDLTCAMCNGDCSKTLAQAQRDKHTYVLDALSVNTGNRMLEIDCGWGPMLKAAEEGRGHGVGLSLSTKQAEACRHNGLEAHIRDWKGFSVGT